MTLGLAGKTVLVTGASRGIGRAVAAAFVEAGAATTILAENDEVHETAKALSSQSTVAAIQCDVTDGAAVDDLGASLGPIDILINNAGIEQQTRLDDPGAMETVAKTFEINVLGTFRVTQAVLDKVRPGGAIINTASVWGRYAPAGYSAYAASKHAVIGLTRSWSRELAGRKIRVNAVCPGWVGTDAALATLHTMAAEQGVEAAHLRADIEAAQDIEGLMVPEDVANLYLFLASPLAANITGQAVNVDRGEYQA
ncbi:MAG: SDR family oxidoreductase [Pseudomonadota bacterium]